MKNTTLLKKIASELPSRKKYILIFIIIAVTGNFLTAISLNFLEILFTSKLNLSSLDYENIFKLNIFHFVTLGSLPLILGTLYFEAIKLGWENSSLKKIFECKTQSIKTDLFYLLIYCSNLYVLLGLFFSMFLGYYLHLKIEAQFNFELMKNSPFWLAFIVQWLIGSFVFYWVHYIQHTKYLWEIHKIHHSSTEMTIINNFRNHPFAYSIRIIAESFPAAILGISPIIVLSYSILSGIIVLLQHSDWKWDSPFIDQYLFIGSEQHRIHHSTLDIHYTKNLGILVLWDKVFGTYHAKESRQVPIGVEDPFYNNNRIFYEMFKCYYLTFQNLLNEIFKINTRKTR